MGTFADVIADEERQVAGGAPACGYVDPGDHGGLTCVRLDHPRYPNPRATPHVGRDRSHELAQWKEPCITPDPVADAAGRAALRHRATQVFLASVDLDALAAALGIPPPPAQAPNVTPKGGT